MRFRRSLGLSLALACLGVPRLHAQAFNLRDLLTEFLREGITLAPPASGPSHVAHFIGQDSPQFLALGQFSAAVANQLSSFPIASSGVPQSKFFTAVSLTINPEALSVGKSREKFLPAVNGI